jgi:hypothetical protein
MDDLSTTEIVYDVRYQTDEASLYSGDTDLKY